MRYRSTVQDQSPTNVCIESCHKQMSDNDVVEEPNEMKLLPRGHDGLFY